MLALFLILSLTQQPEKIALVIDNQIVITTVTEAEQDWKTTKDPKLKAALDIALGTMPSRADQIVCEGHKPKCETMRGIRPALQGAY